MLRRLLVPLWLLVLTVVSCGVGDNDSSPDQTASTSPTPSSSAPAADSSTTAAAPAITSTTAAAITSTTAASAERGYESTVLGPDRAQPSLLEAGASDDGQLIVVYVVADELRLLRCADLDCSEPPEIKLLGSGQNTVFLDATASSGGGGVAVKVTADSELAAIYVCEPDSPGGCWGGVELGDPDPCQLPDGRPCIPNVDFTSVALSPDGLPRIAYLTRNQRLKLAACEDASCSMITLTLIDAAPEGWSIGPPALHIDTSGRAYIDYSMNQGAGDTVFEALVATCEDDSCSGPPQIIRFEGAGHVRTSHHQDGRFLAWTKTGPAFFPGEFGALGLAELAAAASEFADIQVADCDTAGCGDSETVPAGEDWLLAWPHIELVATSDSTTSVVFNHLSRQVSDFELHVTTCDDAACVRATTRPLGIDDVFADSYAAVIHPDTPLRIVYIDEQNQRLRLITCVDNSCAPPTG